MSFARKRTRVRFAPKGASLTEQHFRDRQDVNAIVARCLRGDTSGLRACGIYADTSECATDLHTMLNDRIQSEAIFDSLPDEVKAEYRTPSEFVSACFDETNRAKFEKLGLIQPVEAVKPIDVNIVNPVTPKEGVV